MKKLNNKPFFKIECGNIKGIAGGSTPNVAAKKVLRATKNPCFGMLARFKACTENGGNVLLVPKTGKRKRAVWMYQDPKYLFQ